MPWQEAPKPNVQLLVQDHGKMIECLMTPIDSSARFSSIISVKAVNIEVNSTLLTIGTKLSLTILLISHKLA